MDKIQPIDFAQNVAQNWATFKGRMEIHLKVLLATSTIKEEDESKVAVLLDIKGYEGIEIYVL